MRPNPYAPGEMPRVLAGRDRELAVFADVLQRVADSGGPASVPQVLVAPRGLGKTSLLRVVEEGARSEGFATAWVSCTRSEPLLPEVSAAVARALVEVDLGPRRGGRLRSMQVEVAVPGVRASAELGPAAAPTEPSAPVSSTAALLRDAAEQVRGRGGAGLVLFLDELHAPPLAQTGVLLNALQMLAGDARGPAVVTLGAGLPSTPGHLTQAATFSERFGYLQVRELDEAGVLRALVGAAAEEGVAWSEPALVAVHRHTLGYPFFVQLVGWCVWDAARPERGEVITVEHVVAGAAAADERVEHLFRARWQAATPLDRDVMAAMAEVGSEVVARAEVARRLDRDSGSLSLVRDRLIDRGIIEAAGHGRLRFALPGFADFVRSEGHLPDEASSPPQTRSRGQVMDRRRAPRSPDRSRGGPER